MEVHCDDSFSYGKSRGEMNFFAVRKVYEGTFDGSTWYGAGDAAYYVVSKKKMLKSVIREVDYDGSVLIENEKGIFSCSAQDMKRGRIAFGEAAKCDSSGILAVRYKNQFTIDLSNWFEVGQRCIIEIEGKTLVDVVIADVMPSGNILISYGKETDIIHYTEIEDIKDYLDSTSYLFFTKKKGKATSVALSKKSRMG